MPQPRFTMVVLLIEDVARSVAFYRRLGVEFPPDAEQKTDIQVPIGDEHQLVLTTQFARQCRDLDLLHQTRNIRSQNLGLAPIQP